MENQNGSENLTPSPVQAPSSAKKWYQQKGLLAVVILAVLAGTAVWVYLILNKPQDLGPVVVKHKVATTSTADLMDWKTYTDSQTIFLIKYPPNWEVAERENGVKIFTKDDSLGVQIESTNDDKRLAYIRQGSLGQIVKLAGLDWVSYLHNENNPGEFGDFRTTLALVSKTQINKAYWIIRVVPNEGYQIGSNFSQIISTLKFTK